MERWNVKEEDFEVLYTNKGTVSRNEERSTKVTIINNESRGYNTQRGFLDNECIKVKSVRVGTYDDNGSLYSIQWMIETKCPETLFKSSITSIKPS